jgi:hypothetical protein
VLGVAVGGRSATARAQVSELPGHRPAAPVSAQGRIPA